MTTDRSCPSPAELEALLDGMLPEPEQAALTRHLDACAACRESLDGLGGGMVLAGLTQSLGPAGVASEPALGQVMARIQEGAADAPTLIGPGAPPELHFLRPSDKPGHLGRLGKHEVLEVLGRGGMGLVLKAFDETLHRMVALKVLAPQLAASATARQRFNREARAAAAVRDEHVVAIHAIEEDNGLPYLVMECVDGVSLQERLNRTGPPELREVLRISVQAAKGLAAAHAQGLVHRDVKPANILLENSVERVKLTDFGLARAADDASLTQSGVVAGTPEYMAPEQGRGEAVDPRADLFSLGSVLYTMCAGQPPFRANNAIAVLKRICEDTPRPLQEINPQLPDWLVGIVEKLHAKDPADRFQSAAEVAELLGHYLAQLQQPASGPLPRLVVPKRPNRRLPRRIALGAGFLAVAAVAAYGISLLYRTLNASPVPGAPSQEAPLGPLTVVRQFKGHVHPWVEALAVSPDGSRLLTGGFDNTIRLWNIETGKEIRRFDGHDGAVYWVAFSADGRQALSASADGTARLWNVETGEMVRAFLGHQGTVKSVVFSRDGRRVLTGGADRTVRLWDLETAQPLQTFEGQKEPVEIVAFSPDGALALAGGPGFIYMKDNQPPAVRLWDVASGKEVQRFGGHKAGLEAACFTPDGRNLITGGLDGMIYLWDVASGNQRDTVGNAHDNIRCLALSPDGRYLLVGGQAGNLQLWDCAHRRLLQEAMTTTVIKVAFHPDGRHALTSHGSGIACLWRLPKLPPAEPAIAP